MMGVPCNNCQQFVSSFCRVYRALPHPSFHPTADPPHACHVTQLSIAHQQNGIGCLATEQIRCRKN